MEMKKIKINDNEYSFINESWENSKAWGHKSTLLKNNSKISSGRARYYNRTWESYQYQSVMRSCVYKLMEENQKEAVSSYKEKHNVNRISKVKREEIESSVIANIELKELLSKI